MRRLRLGLLVAIALGALTGCAESSPPRVERCTGATWGIAEHDAIYADRRLFDEDPSPWIDGSEGEALAARLRRAAAINPAPLSLEARVVLQNDVWGLAARVSRLPASSATRTQIVRASAELMRKLAVRTPRESPVAVLALLPARDGWADRESEHPSLSHERLFGLRRLFTVRTRTSPALERALYSTLVAIDPSGRPRATSVTGDLEVLRFEGDRLTGARLFELDRRRLRCDGARASLVEVDHAERVPGLGADGTLARFDPPASLRDLPCARCHEDSQAMSLPSLTLPVGPRQTVLLEQLGRPLDALRE